MQNKNSWIVGIITLVIGIVFTHIYHTQVLDQKMMDNGSNMSMDTMMTSMTANLQGKSGKELEKAFIIEMIPHHQGAVAMAEVLLADKTISPQLRAFAEKIISAQEGEIIQMKEWLNNY